jgi:hypothetical protein
MRLNKGSTGKKVSTALTPEEQDELAANDSGADAVGDSWRLRYSELKDVPIELWPKEAQEYALDDAVATAFTWWEQESGRPATAAPATQTTIAVIANGINIFSGSTDDKGLGAALTNPTELARKKGILTQAYPVTFEGQIWPDVETAWFTLRESVVDHDELMIKLIAAKLHQHQRLIRAINIRGGVEWIKRCSHFTNAKSLAMQAWEGRGTQSRFIRNLISGFEAASGAGSSATGSITTPGQHPASSAQGLSSHTTAPTTPNLVGVAGSLWKRVYENFSANEDPLLDEHRQARSALWLRAMSAHGLRTDPNAVERFASWVEGKYHEITQRLVTAGLVRVEYHLDKKALAEWVTARCRAMNTEDVGTLKKALIHLAGLLGEDDPDSAVALCAANWLPRQKSPC